MTQKQFAEKAVQVLKDEPGVVGLAAAGSWITNELDEFSDLDLILVTEEKISVDKERMIQYAKKLGNFLSGFTGEHVGEPRVLICLFDNPLLHVDIKFLTLEEFKTRIETPEILLDKNEALKKALQESQASFPYPNYQWIEDRFWTWVHYALLKIGRGEYLEACDFMAYLRMMVFGPLLQIKNEKLPRGVRKVEKELPEQDLKDLLKTIPRYDRQSLLNSLQTAVDLYRSLRVELFGAEINLQKQTEEGVMKYYSEIVNGN